MFLQQCAGDAAPGSSQMAFGSGLLLLAPLSNFRAGTLPTTVSLPHSHKPETDSLPACLAACSPSHSLSAFVSFCHWSTLFFLWLLIPHSQNLSFFLPFVSSVRFCLTLSLISSVPPSRSASQTTEGSRWLLILMLHFHPRYPTTAEPWDIYICIFVHVFYCLGPMLLLLSVGLDH